MIARNFEISNSAITLVDRDQVQTSRFDDMQTISADMFDFLESAAPNSYGIITAIGVEYILEEPNQLERLIKLLEKVLMPNGYAIIFPICKYEGYTKLKVFDYSTLQIMLKIE